jgi:hypothetical protein
MCDIHSRIHRPWFRMRVHLVDTSASALTSSTARVARQTFTETDGAMDDMSTKLVALKQSFDSGVNLQTVFISARTLKTVEKLGS